MWRLVILEKILVSYSGFTVIFDGSVSTVEVETDKPVRQNPYSPEKYYFRENQNFPPTGYFPALALHREKICWDLNSDDYSLSVEKKDAEERIAFFTTCQTLAREVARRLQCPPPRLAAGRMFPENAKTSTAP